MREQGAMKKESVNSLWKLKHVCKKIKNSTEALQYKFKEISRGKDKEIEIVREKRESRRANPGCFTSD